MKDLEIECRDLEKKTERQLKQAKEVEDNLKQKEEESNEKRKEVERFMQQLKEREVNFK